MATFAGGSRGWRHGSAGAATDHRLGRRRQPEPLRVPRSAVLAAYGSGVDQDAVRAYWSLRSLTAIRWLVEQGFDPFSPGCAVDVPRSQG